MSTVIESVVEEIIPIGSEYGYWRTISKPFVKRVGKTKPRNRKFVLCRCLKCNSEKEVRLEDIKSGKSTKCRSCNNSERKYTNEFNKINEKVSEIIVTDIESGEKLVFTFDTEFYDEVSEKYWGVRKSGSLIYLRSSDRKNESERVSLHRLVYSLKHNMTVDELDIIDHIDRNTMNNLSCNLNMVSHLENSQNTTLRKDNSSGVKGVYWDKTREKWIAEIQYNKKKMRIGAYINKEDAIKARQEAEKKYHKYNDEINSKRTV